MKIDNPEQELASHIEKYLFEDGCSVIEATQRALSDMEAEGYVFVHESEADGR